MKGLLYKQGWCACLYNTLALERLTPLYNDLVMVVVYGLNTEGPITKVITNNLTSSLFECACLICVNPSACWFLHCFTASSSWGQPTPDTQNAWLLAACLYLQLIYNTLVRCAEPLNQ